MRELDAAARIAAGRPLPLRVADPLAGGLHAIENAVAVMTFANITREPADDWIGTGIAETVTADLKSVPGLAVIGRARVFDAVKNLSEGDLGRPDDARASEVGRRLGATFIVVGGYQRIGRQIRITAQFVDVHTGAVRRTVKVDGPIDEIFRLQDQIVYELSQGLNLDVGEGGKAAIARAETRSVEAYESYARGMMNLRQATRESIDRAIAAFEDATAHDPEYALAWAALGGAYGLKGSFLGIQEIVHKSIDIERRALAPQPKSLAMPFRCSAGQVVPSCQARSARSTAASRAAALGC